MTGVCLQCAKEKCEETDTTKWLLLQEDEWNYRFFSSRPLLNESINLKELLQTKIGGVGPSPDFFESNIEPDPTLQQQAKIKYQFFKPLVNKTVEVTIYENPSSPFFDENRNRLYSEGATFFIKRICVLSLQKYFAISILAYAILILLALAFVLLLIFTVLKKDSHHLGVLWKFWLNIWMTIQLLSLTLFLGVSLPCCVEQFLKILFFYTIRWNYGLRNLINSVNGDSVYQQLLSGEKLPLQYQLQSIKQPFLHNMGVCFCIHLAIFFAYLIFKLWHCLIKKSVRVVY